MALAGRAESDSACAAVLLRGAAVRARGFALRSRSMRIVIFGVTGGSGRAVAQVALARGHRVVGYLRNPEKLGAEKPAFDVVVGGAFDVDAIRRALAGADAAVFAYGMSGDRSVPLYSEGTAAVAGAMAALGIGRLIVISEASYDAHVRDAGLTKRLASGVFRLFAPKVIRERRAQDRVIAESGLDWTVIRPGLLTDRPPRDPQPPAREPRHGLGPVVSRQQLAEVIVDSLADRSTFRTSLYL
jgi:uncharacterized protein YbjT (DUF2867 family)